MKFLSSQSLRADDRQWHLFISYKPQSVRSLLLQHAVSSEKYLGHDIVGKLAHRKFHQTFSADLTIWLSLSHPLYRSAQKVGDHGGTVSLNSVSNSAVWLVSQTGTFLSIENPHVHRCTNIHTKKYTHKVPRLFSAFKARFLKRRTDLPAGVI